MSEIVPVEVIEGEIMVDDEECPACGRLLPPSMIEDGLCAFCRRDAEQELPLCPCCSRPRPAACIVEGKCDWCRMEEQRAADAAEHAAREADESWDGLLGEHVRAERDRRLAACDWTMVADAPTDKDAWSAYRQSLRELPTTFPVPGAVVWPEPPSNQGDSE